MPINLDVLKVPKPFVIQNHIDRYYNSLKPFREWYKILIEQSPHLKEIKEDACYVCPLCLRSILIIFNKHNISANSHFDMDHFPPESVGGKNEIMVCQQCNNRSGFTFEFELINYLKFHGFVSGNIKSTIPITIRLKKESEYIPGFYCAELKNEVDGRIIDFKNINKTIPVREFLEYTRLHPDNYEMNVTGQFPNEKKIGLSLTKAAFLYCFELWGYEFAFSQSAHQMRRVILGEIDCPYKVGYSFLVDENFDKMPKGVCVVGYPENIKEYMVMIPLIDPSTCFKMKAGVFIPNPYDTEWRFYDITNLGKTEMKIAPLFKYDINTNIHGYMTTWDRYINNKLVPKEITE